MTNIYSKQWQRSNEENLIQRWVNGLTITTSSYESQAIPEGLNIQWQDFSDAIQSILDGKELTKEDNQLKIETACYPDWVQWKVRHEALTSIGYISSNKDIKFITRKRPSLDKANTPGAEDAWVIFHGIDNGSVISPRRFIADISWKMRDDEISDEQVYSFYEKYWQLFQWFELIILWHLILTSWSIAREETIPTSGLMQANLIRLSQEQVEVILEINKREWNNNYTLREWSDKLLIQNPHNWEIVPKLEAYRDLLSRYISN